LAPRERREKREERGEKKKERWANSKKINAFQKMRQKA
jgi:hypothetical protein